MEDVFYLCPRKITIPQIQDIFQKYMHGCTEFISDTDYSCLQVHWHESDSLRYIEFYLFPDYMQYVDEEELELIRHTIQSNHVQTVIGILHHTCHIPVVLRYVSALMQEFSGVLGTDNHGFLPCFSLSELNQFHYR